MRKLAHSTVKLAQIFKAVSTISSWRCRFHTSIFLAHAQSVGNT